MISVCIPTYNGAKYIKEQIDSILFQLSLGDEVVISDDGSVDQTLSILAAYNDERIKIFHHDKKRQKFTFGYTTANVEHALSHARGNIIFLADQDDVWLPGKVDLLVKSLDDCHLVLSDCAIADSELNVIYPSKFQMDNVKTGVLHNLWKCGYLGCCMAFKRDILKECLPIPPNVPHDLWIGITSSVKQQKLYPYVTMLYRRHDKNVSATNKKLLETVENNNAKPLAPNSNSFIFKLRYRGIVIWAYTKWRLRRAFSRR